jgi:hypothetical protein
MRSVQVIISRFLSDGNRANAAEGWDLGVIPTFRGEYWWNADAAWKFGVVALPFAFDTEQTLSNDLAVSGQTFGAGRRVRLNYQFHNVRGTAAYRIAGNEASGIRAGGSLIMRYAELELSDAARRSRNSNLLTFPLLFVESRMRIGDSSSLVVRGDALPFFGLRQGLYDFLVVLEFSGKGANAGSFSAGVRVFRGGFSPREEGQNNNEVAFVGPVLRAVF